MITKEIVIECFYCMVEYQDHFNTQEQMPTKKCPTCGKEILIKEKTVIQYG